MPMNKRNCLSGKDHSALVNIRMEIQDAKPHYSKAMHKKMLEIADWLLACVETQIVIRKKK